MSFFETSNHIQYLKWVLSIVTVIGAGLIFLNSANSQSVGLTEILAYEPASIAADEAYREKQYNEAIKLYERIADRALGHFGAGLSYEMLSRPEKAVEEYKKSINADSMNYRAMENLAGLYEKSEENIYQAINLYVRALALDPRKEWRTCLPLWIKVLKSRFRDLENSPVGLFHEAENKSQQGDYDAAIKLYSQAIRLNPDMFQAFFNRAMAHLKNGNREAALSDLYETVKLSPDFRGAYLNICLIKESLGDLDGCLDAVASAVKYDPNDPEALFHMGRISELTGAYDKSMECYVKALSLHVKPEFKRLITDRLSGLPSTTKKNFGRKADVNQTRNLW